MSSIKRRRPRSAALIFYTVAALTVGLTACGGDAQTATTTAPAEAQAATTTAAPATTTTTLPPIGTPFEMDSVLSIPGISEIAGEGTLTVDMADEAGRIEISIDGTVPVVNGETCEFCMKTMELGPGAVAAVDSLFTDHPSQGVSVDMSVGLIGPTFPEGSSTFVVAGDAGATLAKEGAGFRLVEGAAWLCTDRSLIDPDYDASAAPATTTTTTMPEPDNLILLTASDAELPIKADVLAGEMVLVSGTTARAGSSFNVDESWIDLRPGLGLDIGPGGLELFGQWYEEGTRLVVSSSGMLEVAGEAASGGPDSSGPTSDVAVDASAAEFCSLVQSIMDATENPDWATTEEKAAWYWSHVEAYEQLVDVAPAEIQAEAQAMAVFMAGMVELLSNNDWDFVVIIDSPEASAELDRLSDEAGDSFETVDAYVAGNC